LRFLWSRQAADGGLHSETYGLLRSGQSLTPFVLGALLGVPETIVPAPAAAVDDALALITTNTDAEGALGRLDDTAEDDRPAASVRPAKDAAGRVMDAGKVPRSRHGPAEPAPRGRAAGFPAWDTMTAFPQTLADWSEQNMSCLARHPVNGARPPGVARPAVRRARDLDAAAGASRRTGARGRCDSAVLGCARRPGSGDAPWAQPPLRRRQHARLKDHN
jgi:hypothetical protein